MPDCPPLTNSFGGPPEETASSGIKRPASGNFTLKIYHILCQIATYNKFTGSTSMAILTAGRMGGWARKAVKSSCIIAAPGD